MDFVHAAHRLHDPAKAPLVCIYLPLNHFYLSCLVSERQAFAFLVYRKKRQETQAKAEALLSSNATSKNKNHVLI